MALKELVENNPVLMTLSLLLAGFLSGVGTYDAILRIAQLETIPKSEPARLKQDVLEYNQKAAALTLENKALQYQVDSGKKALTSDMLAQLQGYGSIKILKHAALHASRLSAVATMYLSTRGALVARQIVIGVSKKHL